jgi:predicted  nucleic acid-binding Zn-ribbon protein
MSVIPQVACKRCGKEFSALRPRCPYCGTRRVKTGDRVPLTTSSQNRGTPAAERAVINTKWQMKKVAKNSKANCLAINMSNFFIRNMFQRAKVVQNFD